MLKPITASVLGLSLLVTAPAFSDDKHHNKHGNKHHNKHDNKHHNKHDNKHRNKHRNKRHNSNHAPHHVTVQHHDSHHSSGHVIEALIGGVILGSVMATETQTHQASQSKEYGSTVVIEKTPANSYKVVNGRDCYLVNYQNGNEVLTQVPGSNCGF